MRVAVDATPIGSGRGGDETMMRGLLRGLAATARPDDAFVVLVRPDVEPPPEIADNAAFTAVPVARRAGAVHFLAAVPAALARTVPVDLLCTVNHGPPFGAPPLALFVQDLSFAHHPEWYPRTARLRLRGLVPWQARRAAAVLTVSEHARRDLVATLRLPPQRVSVVPNEVRPAGQLDERRAAAARSRLAARGVRGRFLVYLGNVHPRKNVAGLVRAFSLARRDSRLSDVQLVVAGARWWGTEEAAPVAQAPPGSVVLVGPVDDDEREVLLRDAVGLAYLSYFEGFGLPPVEAMARGTPALVADRTSLPEVTAGAALTVDPDDVRATSDALVTLVADEAVRARLVAAGRVRAASFTAAATGRAARAAFAGAIARSKDRAA